MLKNLLLISEYVICVTIAQLLLKLAMNNLALKRIDYNFFKIALLSPQVLIGLFLYALSFLTWLVILSKMELTFAYPLLSLSVVLVAIVSWVFMGETFNIYRFSGMILTILGAWLIVKS